MVTVEDEDLHDYIKETGGQELLLMFENYKVSVASGQGGSISTADIDTFLERLR